MFSTTILHTATLSPDKKWCNPPTSILKATALAFQKANRIIQDKNENTFQSGVVVSSAEFNLLLGYFVTDQQYHSIYNYKYSILYSSYSNTWFSLAYLQNTFFFLCTCFHVSAMSLSFNKHVTKKVL